MDSPNYPRLVVVPPHLHVWNSYEDVTYEVTLELCEAAIGAYAARIAAEKAKINPDPKVIATAEASRAACISERENLDPGDHEQIREAGARLSAMATDIRLGRL